MPFSRSSSTAALASSAPLAMSTLLPSASPFLDGDDAAARAAPSPAGVPPTASPFVPSLASSGAGGESSQRVDTSVKTLRSKWKSSLIPREVGGSSSPIIPSESESESESEACVMSTFVVIALVSMNAPLSLEYLVGHNRPRALSQASNTVQQSDSLAKTTALNA